MNSLKNQYILALFKHYYIDYVFCVLWHLKEFALSHLINGVGGQIAVELILIT